MQVKDDDDLYKGQRLRVRTVAKRHEIFFHVYCIFHSGFMCQTTIIFGITNNGSLVLITLAS